MTAFQRSALRVVDGERFDGLRDLIGRHEQHSRRLVEGASRRFVESGITGERKIVGGVRARPRKTVTLDRLGYHIGDRRRIRSEEHTSELQSLMRISYAVFCLKKKTR